LLSQEGLHKVIKAPKISLGLASRYRWSATFPKADTMTGVTGVRSKSKSFFPLSRKIPGLQTIILSAEKDFRNLKDANVNSETAVVT